MLRAIGRVSRFVRWTDWGPGKVPVLCAVLYYVGLSHDLVSSSFVLDCALFLVFAVLHSALGYVANDLGDREIDALHGKPNAFSTLSGTQGALAFATLLLAAFLSGLPFARRPVVLPLWILWAFFALEYSLPPLRLKERGAWGLGFSFLAQWSLPVLLAFAALGRFGGWDMVLFALSVTVSGATLEIAHQRWDRARDISTGTQTLGSRTSTVLLDRLYAVAVVLDRIALGCVLITMAVVFEPVLVASWRLSPVIPLLVAYAILFTAATYEMIVAAQQHVLLDPYYSEHRSATKLLHETLPNLGLPVYLMVLATFYRPVNGILLVAFLVWRLGFGQADLLWPVRALRTRLGK